MSARRSPARRAPADGVGRMCRIVTLRGIWSSFSIERASQPPGQRTNSQRVPLGRTLVGHAPDQGCSPGTIAIDLHSRDSRRPAVTNIWRNYTMESARIAFALRTAATALAQSFKDGLHRGSAEVAQLRAVRPRAVHQRRRRPARALPTPQRRTHGKTGSVRGRLRRVGGGCSRPC